MHDVAERLQTIEARLDRLLAMGVRDSGERAALGDDAAALAELGLAETGRRLQAVAAAEGAMATLGAVALARTACRLVRLRLPATEPPGEWTPLQPRSRRSKTQITLLPIARMALAGGEAWVCAVMERHALSGVMLVEPPSPEQPLMMQAALLPEGASGPDSSGSMRWLRTEIRDRTQWRVSHVLGPLGAGGRPAAPAAVLMRVRLSGGDTTVVTGEQEQHFGPLLNGLTRGPMRDGLHATDPPAAFRIRAVTPAAVAGYAWPDATTAAVFQAIAPADGWVLTWERAEIVFPVALLRRQHEGFSAGLFRRLSNGFSAALIHIVPDATQSPLRDTQ